MKYCWKDMGSYYKNMEENFNTVEFFLLSCFNTENRWTITRLPKL